MATGSEILKELLISLGWSHDEQSRKKVVDAEKKTTKEFEKESKTREAYAKKARESLDQTVKAFAKYALAAEAMAIAVTAAVESMANSFEKAYYSSSRTGASVKQLNAFQYAASQMGSSAEEAQAAVEGLAKAQRSMPGYANILRGLGASDPSNLVKSLNEIGPALARMPIAQAEARARTLGISENLLLAMRRQEEFQRFEGESNSKYGALGFDPDKAAEAGKRLTQVFRSLYNTIADIASKTAAGMFAGLQPSIEKLNAFLLANGGKISETLTSMADAVLKLATKLAEFVASDDVAKFFKTLSDPKQWEGAKGFFGWFDGQLREIRGLLQEIIRLNDQAKSIFRFFGLEKTQPDDWWAGKTVTDRAGRLFGYPDQDQQNRLPGAGGGVGLRGGGKAPQQEGWWSRTKRFFGFGGNDPSPSTPSGPVGPPGTYRPRYNLSDADLSDSVIAKINGEATGSQQSTDAVINNMLNRIGTTAYGPSGNLTQVAFAPGQYAGYRRADAKRAEYIRSRIRAIAAGSVPDNTNGANEYRASWYHGPWFQHHANAPVVGGNRFAYNPAGGRGPYAAYDKPHTFKLPTVSPFGGVGLNADKLRSQMGGNGQPLGGNPSDNSRNVTIQQTNHNHVTGVSDPTAAAAQIGARQDRHSSQLLRSMQSAVV